MAWGRSPAPGGGSGLGGVPVTDVINDNTMATASATSLATSLSIKNYIGMLPGTIWTNMTSAADNNWTNVTYGNGLFVAVSVTGTGNRVMIS